MRLETLEQIDETAWRYAPTGAMRVPVVLYARRELIEAMEQKVLEQAANVATLPGVVGAVYVMPDGHWGYGFPIGGVAAFDPERDGVVSAGGVGFDISCGVRTLTTGLRLEDLEGQRGPLADALFRHIPAGVGSRGAIRLTDPEMDDMLRGGARWAVEKGWGEPSDLERIEERGCMGGARPDYISARAKERQRREMGTLGSGNHYLEVQVVETVFDPAAAARLGLAEGDVVVSIHSGSRGLGHQIGTEALAEMLLAAKAHGIALPDRELACAPIGSETGQRYLGAMRAAINCALANRQILTHLAREVFADLFPRATLRLVYDVSHNTCKAEPHRVDGLVRRLYVHRKGATRAFPPGHPDIPDEYRDLGQPVLIGGTMGTSSYILAGCGGNEVRSLSSACHGAGRAMSRRQATRQWRGAELIRRLEAEGVYIRSPSARGVAEEAPGAYKDVDAVVESAEQAGLARKVARMRPLVCIKG